MNSAIGYSIDQLKSAYKQCINQEYLVKSGQIAEEGSLEQLVLGLIALKKKARAAPCLILNCSLPWG